MNHAALDEARRLLASGDPVGAARACAAVLEADSRHAAAAHLMGLALRDAGNTVEGLRWLRYSLELAPDRPEFHLNLANALRHLDRPRKAVAAYERALQLAPGLNGARHNLALTLNSLGQHADAERHARTALAATPADADTWVVLGVALAGQARLTEAESAYQRALAIDPQHAIATHNLGALLVQLQRPAEAIDRLGTAARLGVGGFELAANQARAFLDSGDLDRAEAEFARAVDLRPDDIETQSALARLRYTRGDPKFARSVAVAAAANRDDENLQLLFGQLLWRAEQLEPAESLLRDLLVRKGPNPAVQNLLAGVLLDAGLLREAQAEAFAAAEADPANGDAAETLVTILLRRGHAEDAWPIILAQRAREPLSQRWIAYEATAARQSGRESHGFLFDYARLVRTYDIERPDGYASTGEYMRALSEALAAHHPFSRAPLDQTLRNGTQTTGDLVGHRDPVIGAALQAFAGPIADYCEKLGRDAGHPLSVRNSGDARIAGAWSVRLHRDGYHVNHIHPAGWLSSAFYVEVPEESHDQELRRGWLQFGEARYAAPGQQAEHAIQPVVGRLALFPSYLWHGTTPLGGDAPRTTIAFDAVPVSRAPSR